MGDDKFFQTLKNFLRNKPGNRSPPKICKSAEAVMGQEMRYFFLQWVESNGAPEFKLEYTIFRTTKGFAYRARSHRI